MNQPFLIDLGKNETIQEQLHKQGFALDMTPHERASLQVRADNVTNLLRNKILTPAEAGNARQRLLKIIKKRAYCHSING